MVKNILLFACLLIVVCSCSLIKPKDFSYKYVSNSDTGLASDINIDGYYKMQRECDSTFFSVFMFYPDGLFVIATGTDLSEVEKCFEDNRKSTICSYPSWGLYQVSGDTIRTQAINLVGTMLGSTIFRDYLIQPDGSLINLSDYAQPENGTVGNMWNYPNFRETKCPVKSTFTPIATRRDSKQCPFLKLKWFSR